ncbi:MAG: HAD hydrolase-like protein [Candidatus Roizmanbacteria bacterium]|nr:HAD hydrolase-like protein [Candidatus Roizmanbacteria bacterium]
MKSSLETYLKEHPKKFLIFDLDHTLARLEIDWSTYRREIFDTVATFDKQLSEEVPFVSFAGLELANRAIKKHGEFARRKINSFVEEYELTHYHGYSPNNELLDFIRSQRSLYTYYIWTSNMKKTFNEFVEKEKLSGIFSTIIDRDTAPLLKPEIDGFNLIRKPQTKLDEFLMIGDNFTDEGAAKNAHIDFYKVNYFSK